MSWTSSALYSTGSSSAAGRANAARIDAAISLGLKRVEAGALPNDGKVIDDTRVFD